LRMIETAKDIETQILGVPAGLQDYYAAMYGGLQSIRWKISKHKRNWLAQDVFEGLGKRLLLFYSGKTRNSGINNWAMFKNMIDGDKKIKEKFQNLADTTQSIAKALEDKNWPSVGKGIKKEWTIRKTLAEGISTPEIDSACQLAMSEGASAFKVCGAGGGGCFFVFLDNDDEDLKERISGKISTLGISPLPFKVKKNGLQIRIHD